MKIKVMYISNEAALGGAAQSLLDMLKEIRSYIEPIVIIPESGIIEERLKILDISYYIVPFSMGHGPIGKITQDDGNYNFLDNYEAALRLVSIIQSQKIDIVHTNSSVSNVGALASIMAKKPHVWHIRELLEEHYEYDFWDKDLKIELLKQADEVISISDCVKDVFKKKYQIESMRLYNGLDLEKYKYGFENSCTEPEVYKFLIIGAISPGKGQLEAVKAFAQLVKEGICNIQLNIVGPRDEQYVWLLKQYIRKENISEYIHIYSFRKDLSELRKETTFSITCSKMEALGRATLEAMLAGNIVIGANRGGTKEIIGENQERGYLYEQGNYVSLANTIKSAIADSNEKRNSYRVSAQKYVLDNFDSKQYVKEVVKIYNRILEKKTTEYNQKYLDSLRKRYSDLKKKYVQIPLLKSSHEKKAWKMFRYSQKWLHILQNGNSIISYFEQRKWKRIAIYGMGYFGCCLFDELQGSNIEICYGIDRNFVCDKDIIIIRRPEEVLDEVDVIVVTVSEGENNLINWLKERNSYQVVSLWEILDSYNY